MRVQGTGVATARGHDGARPHLVLAGEFRIEVANAPLELPHSVERVVAYLALARRPVARSRVAADLWPEVGDARASGDLRSALWRSGELGTCLLRSSERRIEVAPDVRIDVIELTAAMNQIVVSRDDQMLRLVPRIAAAAEILPDWDDGEWLAVERVRYARLRLEALETAARLSLGRGDWTGAIVAAVAAIEADPFRETAHRLLIDAYLAQGNLSLAVRAYCGFRDLLADELGVEPSAALRAQIGELGTVASA